MQSNDTEGRTAVVSGSQLDVVYVPPLLMYVYALMARQVQPAPSTGAGREAISQGQ